MPRQRRAACRELSVARQDGKLVKHANCSTLFPPHALTSGNTCTPAKTAHESAVLLASHAEPRHGRTQLPGAPAEAHVVPPPLSLPDAYLTRKLS
eukprot:scaffold9536_cov52-Phaeocystis_antarctica.AAC.2